MGSDGSRLTAQLSQESAAETSQEAAIPVVPWLDEQTAGLVRAITANVAQRYPDLRAVLLYGSVARHEERALDDPQPSDVDLLLLFDLEPELERLPPRRQLFRAAGRIP